MWTLAPVPQLTLTNQLTLTLHTPLTQCALKPEIRTEFSTTNPGDHCAKTSRQPIQEHPTKIAQILPTTVCLAICGNLCCDGQNDTSRTPPQPPAHTRTNILYTLTKPYLTKPVPRPSSAPTNSAVRVDLSLLGFYPLGLHTDMRRP
eukprot:1195514-Prorocentrum_minimum.AAC.6